MGTAGFCGTLRRTYVARLFRTFKSTALAFVVCALPGITAGASAQNAALEAIELKRGQIEQIMSAVNAAPEHSRDGLHVRADNLARELGTLMLGFPIELFALDTEATESSVQAALNEESEQFVAHLDWFKSFLAQRFENLQIRIRDERARFDKYENSAIAGISRVFQQDLRNASAAHIDLLVRLLELGERIGRPDEATASKLRSSISVAAEGMSGQILLDATTLRGLRNMRRSDPANTELVNAERAIERNQVRNIGSLELLIGLMERLQLNTSSYRALLLAERGAIGVDILNRDVFVNLLGNRLQTARETVWSEGPNVVFKALVAISIVIAAYLLARFVRRIVTALVQRESVKLHRLMESILIGLSFGIVFVIGLVAALSTIGISLMPMLAGLGVAGIVIGFALQDTLSNFAAGWMILIYRPYDVDDHIIAGGAEGIVKRMNLVSTTIATFDNQRLMIPNSKIWGDVITNLTANRTRRVSIPVRVSYGEDLDRVEQILRDEIAAHEGILGTPPPNVFVDKMGTSEVVMGTHAWVRTPDFWTLMRSLTKRLRQRLAEEGVEIPLPQQDIYVRTLPDPRPRKPVVQDDESAPDTDMPDKQVLA